MKNLSFPLASGASISLSFLMHGMQMARERPAARRFAVSALKSAKFARSKRPGLPPPDITAPMLPVIVESADLDKIESALHAAGLDEVGRWQKLSNNMVSVQATPDVLLPVLKLGAAKSCHTHLKKRKKLHLDRAAVDCRLRKPASGKRTVPQDGKGVVIGIVDSGFDLSHPMFRDKSGALRVEALLEQFDEAQPKTHTKAQLEKAWSSGKTPGFDANGHGTHVASIAGGSLHEGYEGIAPGATFLLVKTNFMDTDEAVQWIFDRAGDRPCVINMSLGHHWGAHDGTDAEERLHLQLTKARPGRILCISAGNEREDQIHIGGSFKTGQSKVVTFDALKPEFALTLWHPKNDKFELTLLAPDGSEIPFPGSMGMADRFEGGRAKIEVGSQPYTPSGLIQHQAQFAFSALAQSKHKFGWQLRLTCLKAAAGRLDGWFNNSGYAEFREGPLVEQARTVGLAATGEGCLAIASHISKKAWPTSDGEGHDAKAVIGRSSSFSSLGPTRDGRNKPDISAPGQFITAALAEGSESADEEDRVDAKRRLLTIEGTSMASPMVTGVVALLLEKNPKLTLDKVRDILRKSARHDAQTGDAEWSPAFGFGKIDVAKALSLA